MALLENDGDLGVGPTWRKWVTEHAPFEAASCLLTLLASLLVIYKMKSLLHTPFLQDVSVLGDCGFNLLKP